MFFQRLFEFCAQLLMCHGTYAMADRYVPRGYSHSDHEDIRLAYTEALANLAACAALLAGGHRDDDVLYCKGRAGERRGHRHEATHFQA